MVGSTCSVWCALVYVSALSVYLCPFDSQEKLNKQKNNAEDRLNAMPAQGNCQHFFAAGSGLPLPQGISLGLIDVDDLGTVVTSLTKIFRRYGLPYRMNMDNGIPWCSFDGDRRYWTQLSIWLVLSLSNIPSAF